MHPLIFYGIPPLSSLPLNFGVSLILATQPPSLQQLLQELSQEPPQIPVKNSLVINHKKTCTSPALSLHSLDQILFNYLIVLAAIMIFSAAVPVLTTGVLVGHHDNSGSTISGSIITHENIDETHAIPRSVSG
ncbi:hypothetical protein BGZ92_000757, partial [Podila epicladia]